jgi:hypothetical protein
VCPPCFQNAIVEPLSATPLYVASKPQSTPVGRKHAQARKMRWRNSLGVSPAARRNATEKLEGDPKPSVYAIA